MYEKASLARTSTAAKLVKDRDIVPLSVQGQKSFRLLNVVPGMEEELARWVKFLVRRYHYTWDQAELSISRYQNLKSICISEGLVEA
jgi:hypothetical protein